MDHHNQSTALRREMLERAGDEDCRHPATEYLGTNQTVEFLRCELCSSVLVRQGDRLWIVPPRSAPERQAE